MNSLNESVFLSAKGNSLSAASSSEVTDSSVSSSVEALGDGSNRSSSRVLAQEKAEIRKKWQNLIHNASKLVCKWTSNYFTFYHFLTLSFLLAGRSRGTLQQAQLLLSEAMSINIPFTTALTSGGSSAQASEDYAAIENARAVLGELVKVIILFTTLHFLQIFSHPFYLFVENLPIPYLVS